MKRTKELNKFILQNQYLFWYSPKEKLLEMSDEMLMEFLLNYSELSVIKKYFNLIGIKKAKEIFAKFTGRKKGNLYPEIFNFFMHYFARHA